MLEKEFGWKGILSEPGRVWREALAASGRAASIDFDCVWSRSGELLTFLEAGRAELSTISNFKANDEHVRQDAGSYQVRTISLHDLLKRHGAPQVMDYLSIDTEGSEFEILRSFDFSSYRFRTITCEHNRMPVREDIHRLLVSNGYRRKFEDISAFDDWYVWEENG
jgi:FkbM family methyltransferase